MKEIAKRYLSICRFMGLVTCILPFATTTFAAQPAGIGGSLLEKLDRIEARLIALEKELIPCTPARYRANQCEPNDTPFDLAVNLCATVGGEVKLEGKLAFESKISAQGGLEWPLVIKVGVAADAGLPLVLTPIPPFPPIVLPSELALGAGGAAGLGLDGCLQVTKLPIGQLLPREKILGMLLVIEGGQSALVGALADAISSAPTSQATATNLQTQQAGLARFDTTKLVQAIQAAQAFASAGFEIDNPLAVVRSPEVSALRAALPLDARLQFFLDNPELMIPDFDTTTPRALCTQFPPTTEIGQKLAPICNFVDGLPSFGTVSGAFADVVQTRAVVADLKNALGGLPEVIKTTVQSALQGAIQNIPLPTPPPPGNTFCNLFPNSFFCR